MGNSKHTEGNWMFKPSGDANFYFLQVESKTNTWLMNIQQNGELSDEEQIANVNLIVESPNILNALIELERVTSGHSSYDERQKAKEKALDLINKLTK